MDNSRLDVLTFGLTDYYYQHEPRIEVLRHKILIEFKSVPINLIRLFRPTAFNEYLAP